MQTDELVASIQRFVAEQTPGQPWYATNTDDMAAICRTSPTTHEATLYEPVVCLILQGRKETWLGDRRFDLGQGQSLIVSHYLPVVARIVEANPAKPYVALIMKVNMNIVRSIYEEMGESGIEAAQAHSIDVGEPDAELVSAMGRMFELVHRPHEAKVLAPLIRREVHFRLLMAQHGAMLRQMLHQDTTASRTTKAINKIMQNYKATISVPDLAETAGMSPSSFHEHFKSLTGTTPLQYQKNLRLMEARRLLLEGAQSVSTVAFEVGYESPTQFSREYARRFGAPPRKDMVQMTSRNVRPDELMPASAPHQ